MKQQKFDSVGVIVRVVSPNNIMLRIVKPEEFVILETLKEESFYCMIVNDIVYFSSKAPFDYVIVNQTPVTFKKRKAIVTIKSI